MSRTRHSTDISTPFAHRRCAGRPLAALAALALAVATESFAGTVAWDGFGNGPLATLEGSTGGYGWSGPWNDVGSSLLTRVSGPGLTFPGLACAPGAAVTDAGATWSDTTAFQRLITPYATPDNRVFISMLYRPDAGYGSYGGVSFGTWPNAVFIGATPGYYSYGFTLGDGLIVDTNVPLIQGVTVLLVFEVEQAPALSQTHYKLWVNPTVGSPQPAYPAAEYGRPGLHVFPAWISLSNDGGVTTDEIRIGTSWASVVPRAGDVTGDGVVNVSDLLAVISSWGPCAAPLCAGDIAPPGGDGLVNVADLLMVISSWG